MSTTSARKLPWWKILVFSLTPALLLFAIVEGAARIAWARLEADALLRFPNKLLNFVQVPDAVVGYRLAPNYESPESMFTGSIGRFQFKFPVQIHHNANGYMQREEVVPSRQKDSLRIVTVGESTTAGLHVDQNYPSVLRNLIRSTPKYPVGIEVINAGVTGYLSDQWTLLAERELAALRPDIVVLYAGWNDFWAYSPHSEAPKKSQFEYYSYLPGAGHWLRSVSLLNAALQKLTATMHSEPRTGISLSVETEAGHIGAVYKFYLLSLDRTVAAFRKENKHVSIVISTLVGRWPYESEDYFRNESTSIWWMKTDKDKDDSKTAYSILAVSMI